MLSGSEERIGTDSHGVGKERKMMIVTTRPKTDRQWETFLAEAVKTLQGQPLVRITLDAVQAVDCSALLKGKTPAPTKGDWDANPRTLLTVLTYCYATGVYNPGDIEDSIQEDQSVSYLAARTFPEAAVLRRFRREHRTLIREVLVRVFERISVVMSLNLDPLRLEPEQWAEEFARADLPPEIRVQFARLAEERILLALLWDGPAMRD